MLLLLPAIIVFAFLTLGSLLFIVCAAMPWARSHSLSIALWCAVFGVCIASLLAVGVIVLFGSAVVVDKVGPSRFPTIHSPERWFWTYGVVVVLVSAVVAYAASWFHQIAIHRMTFALFRVYAAVVCAGMGSVLGWALGIWLGGRGVAASLAIWMPAMAAFVAGFGFAGWRGARRLRGEAPKRLTWVTRDEFEGT